MTWGPFEYSGWTEVLNDPNSASDSIFRFRRKVPVVSPGEGYRLLEEHEIVTSGDEALAERGIWFVINWLTRDGKPISAFLYKDDLGVRAIRRRIAPVVSLNGATTEQLLAEISRRLNRSSK